MDPIELGPLSLYPFGLALTCGLLGCLIWSLKAASGDRERKALECFWLLALPLGLILARLGYALCSLDMIEDEFFEVLTELPGSGFLLYGGLAGAALALALSCRVAGSGFLRTADRLAGPFLLFGAVCALAEGIAGGGYGWKVEDWFLSENSMSLLASEEPGLLADFFGRFPFAVTDSFYGYANWAVFLPVALFLAVFAVLTSRLPAGQPGNRITFSLSLYACVRVLYESLRQDDIPKWGFVRVNQILSAILLLILILLCWRKVRQGLGVSLALLLGGILLSGAMEFALEKKIGFLEWMPMDLCYLVSGAGCALLFLAVNRLRKRALA